MKRTPNLLYLRYPMFETTEAEKQILRVCDMDYVLRHERTEYLCARVATATHALRTENTTITLLDGERLRRKIMAPLIGSSDLTYLYHGKLGPYPNHETKVMLRRVWIQKLLAYQGT